MDVSLWMTRDLLTALPTTTVADAAQLMAKARLRHLVIVDRDHGARLVGVLSSHDLMFAADSLVHPLSPRGQQAAKEVHVAEVMTRSPYVISPNCSLDEAARILRDRKFSCLPVVDRERLVGIVTEHDILRAFMQLSGADETGCELTLTLDNRSDAVHGIVDLGRSHGLHLSSVISFQHDGKRLGIVRFAEYPPGAFLDAVWRSGHKILRVRSMPASATAPKAVPSISR